MGVLWAHTGAIGCIVLSAQFNYFNEAHWVAIQWQLPERKMADVSLVQESYMYLITV